MRIAPGARGSSSQIRTDSASTRRLLFLPRQALERGMAGSFGYEAKHYDMSINIGNQILFPAILKANNETIISAPGTSCREHIKHSTDRNVLHPIEVLWRARK